MSAPTPAQLQTNEIAKQSTINPREEEGGGGGGWGMIIIRPAVRFMRPPPSAI